MRRARAFACTYEPCACPPDDLHIKCGGSLCIKIIGATLALRIFESFYYSVGNWRLNKKQKRWCLVYISHSVGAPFISKVLAPLYILEASAL